MSFGGFGSGGGFGSNNNNASSPFGGGAGGGAGGGGGFGSNTNSGGFGSTTGTGFGSNTNTGSSLFGGGSSNNGFGSGGFGANQNTSSGFGSNPRPFGSTPATTGGSLFGGNSLNAGTSSGFGSGGFGSNPNNNTSSGFGSNSTGGGLFSNQNTNNSSGFGGNTAGSGSGLFGGSTNNTTGTGFGNSTSGFGSGNTGFGNSTPQNNGTGAVPFSPFSEKDGASGSVTYQSIPFQQPYQQFSFEELRLVDYQQGRKFANASGQAGSFGMSTGFGGTASNTGATGFGGGGGFGGSNPFGQQNNASGTTGGLFGSQQNNNATSTGFGSSNTGSGLFGAKSQGQSLFGQQNTTTTSQPSTGLFGSSNTSGFGGAGNTGNTGGSLFGNQQNKPFGGTGSNFGGNNQGSSLFGNNANNNAGSSFGQPQTSPFGGGSAFGQNNQNNSGGTGLFGNQNNNTNNSGGGLFGQKPANQAGSSLFGNNQQNNQPSSAGLFGSSNNNNNSSGGIFGQKPANQSTGLFGNNNNNNNTGGSSLFSSLGNNNNQQNAGGSLFGNQNQQKPSGLFGNNTNNTGNGSGLFGGLNQNNNQQPTGSSLFGNTNQQQPQLGSSLFGSSQQQQQQQLVPQQPTQLTTSILAQHPYGNEGLFASLAPPQQSPGPVATPLAGSQKSKKPAMIPYWRQSPAASSRNLTPQKRGGYGFSYSTYGTPGSAYGSPRPSSIFGNSNRSLNGSRSTSNLRNFNTENSLIAPGAFTPGAPSTRPGSMKKLNINRNIKTSNLFGDNESADRAQPSPLRKAVSFDDESPEAPRRIEGPKTNGEGSSALVRVEEEENHDGPSSSNGAHVNGSATAEEMERIKRNELAVVPEDGATNEVESEAAAKRAKLTQKDQPPMSYYMIPSKAELRAMSRSELKNLGKFVVGRVNAGSIEFENANLDGISIDSIMGGIVVIETRSATVYPDHSSKPPEGKGLNIPAIVTLENSWPRSRAGQLPVFEKRGTRFEKHVERLKRVSGTQFIDYRVETGQWVFRVDHFSSYELDYSEEEKGDAANSSSMLSAPPDSIVQMSHPDTTPFSNQSLGAESSNVDDTFAFRFSRAPPGTFDDDAAVEYESLTGDVDQIMEMTEASVHSNAQINGVASDIEPAQPLESSQMAGSFPGLDGNMDVDNEAPRYSPKPRSSMQPKSILKPTQRQASIFGSPIRTRPGSNAGWADQLQRTLSPKKQDRQALRESQGQILSRQRSPDVPRKAFSKDSNPFATSIDIMNSLWGEDSNGGKKQGDMQIPGNNQLKWPYARRPESQDGAGMMDQPNKDFHDSFKPHWNPDGTLVVAVSDEVAKEKITLLKAKKSIVSHSRSVAMAQVFPSLLPTKTFLKLRSVTIIEHSTICIPYAHLPPNFTFSTLSATLNPSDPLLTLPEQQHEKSAWELCQILFDAQDPSLSSTATASIRKENLSTFWKALVTPAALRHVATAKSSEEKALAQLSAFDIWGATETLLNAGDFRLGCMIAQVGGAKEMQEGICDQIDCWRERGDLAEMPAAIRALYEILAGNTCVAEGYSGGGTGGPENRAETFGIAARFGLDWKRAFGLRLWYGTDLGEGIAKAVRLYEGELQSRTERVKPVPWFIEEKAATGWNDPKPQERQDILWGLLKIYAWQQQDPQDSVDDTMQIDLADILTPENTSGHPLNALFSFQLAQTLSATGTIDFSSADDRRLPSIQSDLLTATLLPSFTQHATALPSALFTVLHLSDPQQRATTIQDLLNLHAAAFGSSPSSCALFARIVEELKIPAEWVYKAKAVHARAVGHDPAAQCLLLLQAKDVVGATTVLRRVVGPLCIIEGERGLARLKSILEAFDKAEAVKAVGEREWEKGGGMYAAVVRLLEVRRQIPSHGAGKGTPGMVAEGRRLVQGIKRGLEGRNKVGASGLQMGLEERVARFEVEGVVSEFDHKVLGTGGAGGASGGGKSSVGDRKVDEAERLFDGFYSRLVGGAAS